jgi:hypothetical protein
MPAYQGGANSSTIDFARATPVGRSILRPVADLPARYRSRTQVYSFPADGLGYPTLLSAASNLIGSTGYRLRRRSK